MTCNETVLTPEIAGEGGSVESLLYTSEDIAFMTEAKDKKIRRSVQAGEFGPPDMVFQAIEKLGADRVVFGYSVPQEKIGELLKSHDLILKCYRTRLCITTSGPTRSTW